MTQGKKPRSRIPVAVLAAFSWLFLASAGMASGMDQEDLDFSSQAAGMVSIYLKGSAIEAKGKGVLAEGSRVAIVSPGTYRVSGKLSDGGIRVDSAAKGTVRIILAGASIHSSTDSPLRVERATKVVITLAEGTINALSDSPSSASDAVIHSSCDLTINGYGRLSVEARRADGIASSDGLTLAGGGIEVKAADDGVKGRDSILASDPRGSLRLTVSAGGDGMKTTYGSKDGEDETGKGVLRVAGGELRIVAGQECIQTAVAFELSGGNFLLESGDDAIHSDRDGSISGGTYLIEAGGQGIKVGGSTRGALAIGGESTSIDIRRSTEGIAGFSCHISGGTIRVQAGDDGFSMSAGERKGGTESNDGSRLTISGGRVAVRMGDSGNDAIDTNGDLLVSGGTLLVHGPSRRPECGVDYNGSFRITGGIVAIASNLNEMTRNASEATQRAVLIGLDAMRPAGTLLSLRRGKEEILAFKPDTPFQALILSAPGLAAGEYVLYAGGSHSGRAADGLYEGGAPSGGTQALSFSVRESLTAVGVQEPRFRGRGGFGGRRPL